MRRLLLVALVLSIFPTLGSSPKAFMGALSTGAYHYAKSLKSKTVNIYHDKLARDILGKVVIRVGSRMMFVNKVNMPSGHTHTLVANDGSFISKRLVNSGDAWHHTFHKAGIYRYHIREHPDVMGVITVVGKK